MCNCGCNTCDTKKSTLMLNENLAPRTILSEGLKYHIDTNKPLTEHLYRAGSRAYFDLFAEARSLYSRGILEFTNEDDLALLTETNLGHFGMFEGKKVPLDFPIELSEEEINEIYDLYEAKKKKAKKKDNRPIGKPMRDTSGGKAYKVYVKDPKTKKVKTVRFGSGGLRAKINDSKARKAFAARHKCSQKKDRTKASYWSCRLPRYAKLLGLKSSFSGFW